MMITENFITPALYRIDAYKLGHKKMYPEGTELVYNNFTPRSEKLSSIPPHLRKNEVVVIGVQRFVKLLKTVWDSTFFSKNCDEVVSEWEELIQPLAGSIKYDASHIRALHNLGYLPLEIKSIQKTYSKMHYQYLHTTTSLKTTMPTHRKKTSILSEILKK